MSIESTFWGEPITFEFNSWVSFWIQWSISLLVAILYDSYNVDYQANKYMIVEKYVCVYASIGLAIQLKILTKSCNSFSEPLIRSVQINSNCIFNLYKTVTLH